MTQIIERVAQIIAGYKTVDWPHRKKAERILEEIKPDLKKAHDLILNSPMGSHMTDEAMEILQALLSELEQSE